MQDILDSVIKNVVYDSSNYSLTVTFYSSSENNNKTKTYDLSGLKAVLKDDAVKEISFNQSTAVMTVDTINGSSQQIQLPSYLFYNGAGKYNQQSGSEVELVGHRTAENGIILGDYNPNAEVPQLASGENSMAFGSANQATADYAVGIGNANTVSEMYSFGVGDSNTVAAFSAFVMGSNNNVGTSANSSMVIGYKNTANNIYSTIFGRDCVSNGNNSILVGRGLKSNTENQFVIGKYNDNSNEHIFEIGFGQSDTQRSNLLCVDYDGDLHCEGTVTASAFSGNAATATKATSDSNGNNIYSTYVSSVTASVNGLTVTKAGTDTSVRITNLASIGENKNGADITSTDGASISSVYGVTTLPTSYGERLIIKDNRNGIADLLLGWSTSNGGIAHLYYRNKRDAVDYYSDWSTIAFTTDNVASATKATQDGSGNVITSTYLPLAGGTLTGLLSITNTGIGNYSEGIRIHTASSSWATIMFCGSDNTGDSGTSPNSWGIFNNEGNFYITRNGSDNVGSSTLSNVNNLWGVNTNTPTHTLTVNGSGSFTNDLHCNGDIYYKKSVSTADISSGVLNISSLTKFINISTGNGTITSINNTATGYNAGDEITLYGTFTYNVDGSSLKVTDGALKIVYTGTQFVRLY